MEKRYYDALELEDFFFNPWLSAMAIFGVGVLVSASVKPFSTDVAFLISYGTLIISFVWATVLLCATHQMNTTFLLLGIFFLSSYWNKELSHTYFKPVTVTQMAQPEFSITGGLFTDTAYLHGENTMTVTMKTLDIPHPYKIEAKTTYGWFKQTYFCEEPVITEKCGRKL